MKKYISLVLLLLGLTFAGCSPKEVQGFPLPFAAGDVTTVELYHQDRGAALMEKKTMTRKTDIRNLCDALLTIPLQEKTANIPHDASITTFRFLLADGGNYSVTYYDIAVKSGMISSPDGGCEYFTSSNVEAYWSAYDYEAEPVEQSSGAG